MKLPTPKNTRRALVASVATLGLTALSLLAQAPAPAGVAPGAANVLPADPANPAAAGRGGPGAGAAAGRGGGRGGAPAVPGGSAADADFTPRDPIKAKTMAEQAKTFVVPPGYRIEGVISDPDIQQPAFIEFDGNGRMYVGEMRTYMLDASGTGEYESRNRISRWESTKGDGVFDKHTVFIDNIAPPRNVLPLDKNRVLVNETHSDNLDMYTDTDGDGVADKKETVFTGVGLGRDGNIEHEQSGFVWAMDNWIYSTYNTFRFRWSPTGGFLKEPIPASGGSWGISMDDDGKTWNVNPGGEIGPVAFQIPVQYGVHDLPEGMETDFQIPWPIVGIYDQQGGMGRARTPIGTLNHFTATTGPDVFRGTALPDDLKGDLLFTEPVGRLIRRTKIVKTEGITQLRNVYPNTEFILGTDPLFRPVNLKTGPDGSLYIVDMYHGIIQDTQWSRPGTYLYERVVQLGLEQHINMGRIWRLRYDGIKPYTSAGATIAGKPAIPLNLTQPRMYDETPAQLVAHLNNPNGWWRDNAQRLLVLKQDKSVVPALTEIVKSSDNLLARFHALWALEGLNAMPAALVREQLKDPNPRMRIQAIRASETLYKAGDRSFETEYRAMMKDSDTDVAIQAMLTGNFLKLKDIAAAAKDLLPKNETDPKPAKGIVEFATWIGNGAPSGRGGGGGGGAPAATPEQQELLAKGTATFTSLCFECHGTDGRGSPLPDGAPGATLAPALAGNARVQGHRDYVIKALLNGVTGPVEGKTYSGVMIAMNAMNDDFIAGVASYVRNSFGNSAGYVTAADVARVRAANTRTTPWTVTELQATLPVQLDLQPTWKTAASAPGATTTSNTQNAFNLTGWTMSAAAPAAAEGTDAQWFQVELPTAANLTEITFNAGGGGRGGGGGGRAGAGAAGGGRGAAGGGGGGPAGPVAGAAPAAAPAANPAVLPVGAPPAAAAAAPARQFGVQVSADGANWTALAATSRTEGTLTMINFKPTPAKFVRITSAPPAGGAAAWAITNLRLFQAGR
jgi:mono/diheme cytochrome c family protein